MILRILRLSTGEDIVGDIIDNNDESVTIENPCILVITINREQEQSLNMSPYLLFSNQKVLTINKKFIMFDVSVANEIQSKYNEIYAPEEFTIRKN
jgi:hypothetical protein